MSRASRLESFSQFHAPETRTQSNDQHPRLASSPVLMQSQAVVKSYRKGKIEIPVLHGIDFEVREQEMVSIVGASGSGKSTLLHLLGTLDAPDEGEIYFEGNRIDNLPAASREILRNQYFGMIFQFYHLLPELTTLENVLMPLMIQHPFMKYLGKRRALKKRAKELLEMVGLSHRLRHKPKELSGGEMQRVAIARALISEPRLLLADEPTGNLDSKTTDEILSLFQKLHEQGKTIILVTHEDEVAAHTKRIIRLYDGEIAVDTARDGTSDSLLI